MLKKSNLFLRLSDLKCVSKSSKEPKYQNVYNLIFQTGVWDKADIDYYYKVKNDVSKYPTEQKELLRDSLLTHVNKIVLDSGKDVKTFGKFCYLTLADSYSSKILDKIKKVFLKSKVANELILSSVPEEVSLPYLENPIVISGRNKKFLKYTSKDNIMIHPRDVLNNVIKNKVSNHLKFNVRNLSGDTLKYLLEQKNKLLKEISTYIQCDAKFYDFLYTKKEIKHLELLSRQYDAIEALLLNNGVQTKNIETILFSNLNKAFKIGDTLPNGDILLKHLNIFDINQNKNIPAIMTFANTDRGYRFKIYKYDKKLYEQIPMITKKYGYYARTCNVASINNLNEKLSNSFTDNEIAEVYLKAFNQEKMKKLMGEDNMVPSDIMDKLLQNNEKYYYIKNLKNYNPKKYQNASAPLIVCLKEFGMKNNVKKAFLEAFAFDNIKHSPVFLYLRAGCTPISSSRKDLEMFLHNGYDYKKNVWLMYEL